MGLALRHRSVRRVEWKLEGASRLLEMCRVGDSIESPPFSAAGLERIQFHFYPRGYEQTSASGPSQPCALYLTGPARTTIRCMLWVGPSSRQLEHRFQRRGDTGGRNNLGPLEKLFDCDDCVLIALDIAEVETDLPEQGAAILLRDARPASNGKPTKEHASPAVNGAKGSLRMKRDDPSKTEELAKCISLPALNTRQHHLPLAKANRRNFMA